MKKLNKVLTILAASIITTSAFAVEAQGELDYGNTNNIRSTGKFDVTLGLDYAIQINNLKDIDLGDFQSGTDSGAKTVSSDFCVFTNATSFSLNVAGGNAGFIMTEENDANLTVDYTVEIATKDVNDNPSAFQTVSHNQTITGISETRNRINCSLDNVGTKNNMLVQVSVSEQEMLDSIPGSYKDTITLIASPE